MEKRIVALLTGRGNNTLKDKNVADIDGKPVLYYIANAAKKAKFVNDWYCSSESEKILDAAEQIGYKPLLRPAEYASDTAQHVDCILYSLEQIKELTGQDVDIVVVLLANNVTAKSEWIDACIQKMLDDDSLSSVVPAYHDNDHHPLRAKTLDSQGLLSSYEKSGSNVSSNRQDLTDVYFLAHNFWVIRASALKNKEYGEPPWSFLGKRVLPYEIERSVDIHDPFDIKVAQAWISEHYQD